MSELPQTGLNHFDANVNQLHASVFNQHCVDWSVSVLTIKACIDVSVPSASVEVYLAGHKIGACTLSPQHPNCTIGGSFAGFKAEVTLAISNNCLNVEAELCAPIVGCKKWNHDLFCW